MKRINLFLFFLLPFSGIIVLFTFFSTFNRNYVKKNVEALVEEQLFATAGILKVNISHLIEEDFQVEKIFNLNLLDTNIYYMALLDENHNIQGWSSRFEGFLPISKKSLGDKTSWIIDSPTGKIFNILSPYSTENGRTHYLYLGYSMNNIERMFQQTRKSFYFILGIMFSVGIAFFFGLYKLQNNYFAKKQEAEEEKKEKERYREISAFTSGVAHEIKNPLNSLALLFELFHKRNYPCPKEDLEAGKKEIQKISRIIDRFSASLKPLTLNRTRLALKQLVDEVKESLLKEVGDEISKIQSLSGESIEVFGDSDLLFQAFYNLFKNAVEATESGRIHITAETHKTVVTIKIHDEGRGMSHNESLKAFEPFFSSKTEGMGIGLYLTRKIIEAHNGKIEFHTILGKGSTFIIELPGRGHE